MNREDGEENLRPTERRKKMRKERKILRFWQSFWALAIMGFVVGCWLVLVPQFTEAGAGLRTQAGEVVIENLKIGQTYNTRELVDLPLRVINTGDETVDLKIELYIPLENEIRRGYEPIPDISWVKLSKDFFTVGPGESAVADVIISIPDDEEYFNKRYQFNVWSHTVGSGKFIALGLDSRFLFTIADVRVDVSEERYMELIGDINFSLLPHRLHINSLKLGKKYNIKKLTGVSFKLINPNERKFTYRMTSLDTKKDLVQVTKGWEDCPDPSFLTFGKSEFSVGANEIKKISAYLEFPDKEEYKGKKYLFIIYTEVLGQAIPFGVYNNVYVTTEE